MNARTAPLISVVMPSYKQGRYLRESVGSVIAQTYLDWEIIIVDDGSPDDTAAVAQVLIDNHPTKKMRLLRKVNGGAADARNAGIREAQGRWVVTLDADDRIEPTFLEKAMYVAENIPGTNFVYSNLQEFEEGNKIWIGAPYSLSSIMAQNTFPCCSMFKKELWVRAGGYPKDFPWGSEDYAFWISLAKLGLMPQRIDEELFHYRYKESGNASSLINKYWQYYEPMMHTMHADLYPSKLLAVEHERIGVMCQEYFEGLQKKVLRFPELAFPHFWMGLKHEHDGNLEAALSEYDLFYSLHYRPDWQVLWRELLCRVKVGSMVRARQCYDELVTYFPELVWMRAAADPLFLSSSRDSL